MLGFILQKKEQRNEGHSTGSVVEKPIRSVAKAISWRVAGTIDTVLISFLLTGSITAALSIGGTELVTKMCLYYFHERLWSRLSFGKEIIHPPEYEI